MFEILVSLGIELAVMCLLVRFRLRSMECVVAPHFGHRVASDSIGVGSPQQCRDSVKKALIEAKKTIASKVVVDCFDVSKELSCIFTLVIFSTISTANASVGDGSPSPITFREWCLLLFSVLFTIIIWAISQRFDPGEVHYVSGADQRYVISWEKSKATALNLFLKVLIGLVPAVLWVILLIPRTKP